MLDTTRQKYIKVLLLACDGMTGEEIGKKIGKSRAAVENIIVRLRHEYEAKNIVHLVSILYQNGIL